MRKSDLKKALMYLKKNLSLETELESSINQLIDKVEDLKVSSSEVTGDKSLGLPPEFSDFINPIGLFTDGACRGNPGPGAWAAVLQENDKEFVFEMSGHEEETTNNRMELDAVISGLKEILILEEENRLSMKDRDLLVFSDSKYVLDGIQKWTKGWKARGWRKADGKPPENLSRWMELDILVSDFDSIHFFWVKGHAGHPQNEYVDLLANKELDEQGF